VEKREDCGRIVFAAALLAIGVAAVACETEGTQPGVDSTRPPDPTYDDAGTPRPDGSLPYTPDTGANDAGANDTGPNPKPDADAPCDLGPLTAADTPPRSQSFSISVSGQTAWIHDDQKTAGYFHTYDALVPKAGAEAHKVHVFLPRGYGTGCKRYPVVYMNDGDTSFWPGGAANKSWSVAEVLAAAYTQRSVREVIVVAIVPVNRNREYTHAAWLPGETCCGGATYVSYLADTLVPFIDSGYRTKKGRADTFVLGSSHGGLAAFYAAARRPEVFGGAIAMSSSFWAGLDNPIIGGPLSNSALLTQVGPTLAAGAKPIIYLDWGLVRDGGTHNAFVEERATARSREMATLLEGPTYGYVRGRNLFTVEDPKGEHDELSWSRRLGNALARVIGP
jgi:predicted alpha/beta superfamily hydrolase